MTHLIGLTGRRGSGKDTAFGFIHGWAESRGLRASRRGFADTLKWSFARLFLPDCSMQEAIQWCNELKDQRSNSMLSIEWGRLDSYKTLTGITHAINGRQALQRYGTEGHRDIFDEDFWVNALLPLPVINDETMRIGQYVGPDAEPYVGPDWRMNFAGLFGVGNPAQAGPPDFAVITDLRFENEARRIKDLGGIIWEIDRPADTRDDHASEVPLPRELIDGEIKNHSTLDHFEGHIIAAMVGEFHMKGIEYTSSSEAIE